MKALTSEEIGKLIRETPHGKSFSVQTDDERRKALLVAPGAGKRVHSRKNGKSGFTIYVLE